MTPEELQRRLAAQGDVVTVGVRNLHESVGSHAQSISKIMTDIQQLQENLTKLTEEMHEELRALKAGQKDLGDQMTAMFTKLAEKFDSAMRRS